MYLSEVNSRIIRTTLIIGLIFSFGISTIGQSLLAFDDMSSFEKILKGKTHFSIDSDGKLLVIGDYHYSTERLSKTIPQVGCVLIYIKDESGNWNFAQEIKSPRGKAYDNFGVSVAISDKYLVIGALGEDHMDENGEIIYDTGAAYFYQKDDKNNFQLVQKICSSDLKPYSIFGSKVDIKDDEIIIDSHTEENNNTYWIANTYQKNENNDWQPVRKSATDGHIKNQTVSNILSE